MTLGRYSNIHLFISIHPRQNLGRSTSLALSIHTIIYELLYAHLLGSYRASVQHTHTHTRHSRTLLHQTPQSPTATNTPTTASITTCIDQPVLYRQTINRSYFTVSHPICTETKRHNRPTPYSAVSVAVVLSAEAVSHYPIAFPSKA